MLASIRRSMMVLAFLGLITTNVLTLFSTAFFNMASGFANAGLSAISSLVDVSDISTVQDKHKKSVAAKERKLQKSRVVAKRVGTGIRARTKTLAAASVAAIPAETVPIIGVGSIIAVTAYELAVACENFNDLNEMYTEMEIYDAVDRGVLDEVCNPQLPTKEELFHTVTQKKEASRKTYNDFNDAVGGTIAVIVDDYRGGREKFDDAVGGTIDGIIKRWGW